MSKYSYYRKDIPQEIFYTVVNASLFVYRNNGFFNNPIIPVYQIDGLAFPTWKKNIYDRDWTLVKNKFRILKKDEVVYCRIAMFRKAARYMRINFFQLRDYFFSLSMIAFQDCNYCEQTDSFYFTKIPFVFEDKIGKIIIFEKRRLAQWCSKNSD